VSFEPPHDIKEFASSWSWAASLDAVEYNVEGIHEVDEFVTLVDVTDERDIVRYIENEAECYLTIQGIVLRQWHPLQNSSGLSTSRATPTGFIADECGGRYAALIISSIIC
jgi:hypothetical protein